MIELNKRERFVCVIGFWSLAAICGIGALRVASPVFSLELDAIGLVCIAACWFNLRKLLAKPHD